MCKVSLISYWKKPKFLYSILDIINIKYMIDEVIPIKKLEILSSIFKDLKFWYTEKLEFQDKRSLNHCAVF